MKTIFDFIKTSVVGGVVVVIPIALIVISLGKTFKSLITKTEPLTENMMYGPLANAIIATVIVIAGVILVFFIVGVILKTIWGKSIQNWLEKRIYENIPMFSTFKQLTQRITGIENSNFPVVEIDLYGTGVKVLGVVVEKLEDERLMVYAPSSPLVTVGQLYVVPNDRINELNASIHDTLNCLSQAGLEASKVYSNKLA